MWLCGGVGYSLTYFGTRPSDRAQIWHACADRYSHHNKIKNLTHPTPGGFRGLYIVKNLSRRIAPKFGTHVRIDTLTLKKIKCLTHPTPGGFSDLKEGVTSKRLQFADDTNYNIKLIHW